MSNRRSRGNPEASDVASLDGCCQRIRSRVMDPKRMRRREREKAKAMVVKAKEKNREKAKASTKRAKDTGESLLGA